MEYQMDLSGFRAGKRFGLGPDFAGTSPGGERISFTNFYMESRSSRYPGSSITAGWTPGAGRTS